MLFIFIEELWKLRPLKIQSIYFLFVLPDIGQNIALSFLIKLSKVKTSSVNAILALSYFENIEMNVLNDVLNVLRIPILLKRISTPTLSFLCQKLKI